MEIKAPIVGIQPREDKIKKREESKKAEEMQKKEEERIKKLKPIKQGVDFVRENNDIKEVESLDKNKKSLEEISKECGIDLDDVPDLD